MRYTGIFCIALLSFIGLIKSNEYPRAPALAISNWPIAHGSTWNSDTSGFSGPPRSANDVELLLNGDNILDLQNILLTADSITITQSSVNGYMWASGVSGVYQLRVNESGASIINTLFRDVNFEYHGAYSLLGQDGTYFAAAKTSIQAYNNEVPFDFTTPIVKTREYFVNNLVENEHIVGLTVTHDEIENAFLVYATTRGQVGAVSLDFLRESVDKYQIEGIDVVELPDHFVSNSIAMDGMDGGVYVCTSKSMTRLQWDLATLTMTNDWITDYGTGKDGWYYGRLGPGCGTSPTIMGPNGAPEYVVITDGETPMNILFYDTTTGVLAGKHSVSFGNATNGNSTTDQSITVLGYKAVVVNNWINDEVTSFCSEWFASTDASDALKKECPYLFGQFVNGIEQFEINPKTGEVSSVWSNSEVSCTSTVPIVSSNEVFYCAGKRIRAAKRDVFTIEAVDWNTGVSLYHVEISSTLLANGLYAGTIIGTEEDIVMGTLSGILRVSKAANADAPRMMLNHQVSSVDNESDLPNVWQRMQLLADWNKIGYIPSVSELMVLGLTMHH